MPKSNQICVDYSSYNIWISIYLSVYLETNGKNKLIKEKKIEWKNKEDRQKEKDNEAKERWNEKKMNMKINRKEEIMK